MEIAHETDPLTDSDMELFSVPRMRGIGKNRELFSVEFSTSASYKKMEVKLNNNYVVSKTNSAEEEIIILSCTKSFSLFEIIHAILFEMSYYGDPESRVEVLNEVLASLGVDKIEAFKLKDRDDIERLKKELQTLIDQEDYEEAAKLRDKIKRMLGGEEQSDSSDV
jgi:protein-arginine kinase activator protein McsA